ncbi:MAG TPA: restriction endonuclease [Opitutus sp.]|nr:restriction endonuclease [Opitutus sp.]
MTVSGERFVCRSIVFFALATSGRAETSVVRAESSRGPWLEWGAGIAAAVCVILLFYRLLGPRGDEAGPARSDAEEREDSDLALEYPYCTDPPPREEVKIELREPLDLTPEVLRDLEWKRFEELVCGYYEAHGMDAQRTHAGLGAPVNICLYRAGEHRPCAYVQCDYGLEPDDGAGRLRALRETATGERVEEGVAISQRGFATGVREEWSQAGLHLIDGDEFLNLFAALPLEQRDRIVRHVTREDYRTPTCPACDLKMTRRDSGTEAVWVCRNYPRCQRMVAGR